MNNNINLKGKRLLILGGTTLMIHVVETAKKMGVFTIVTDIDPNSPAKSFSDLAFNVSTGNIEELYDLCIKEKVDGVFTGYEDFNTSIACELCALLNKPFYATKEQIDLTKNKILFKETCKSFGVPVVKEYSNNENIEFPVVSKPADSYSGKGISICRNEEELKVGIDFALKYSKSNQYLLEKFMDSRKVECINIDYLIKDGEVKLSAIGDKYVNNEQGNKTPLTSAVLYPSIRQFEYINTLDKKVKNMFKHLNMKNGTLFIESFYDEEGFHFYEMGYRVGGGQSSILLNRINGVDYVKMLISFALDGTMCDDKLFNEFNSEFSEVACSLVLLMKDGAINRVEGLDFISKNPDIVKYTQFFKVGESLSTEYVGTLGQVFARIHIVSENINSFKKTLNDINHNLKVYDSNNNNLLLSVICEKMLNRLNS